MTLHHCIACGKIWGIQVGDEKTVPDFCSACSEQGIDDLVEEIAKKEGKDKDLRMRNYWKKKKVNP